MPALLEEICRKIASDRFEFSKHTVDHSILRSIRVQEIREAIATGQLIEDYPNDKYGPSCLISGLTKDKSTNSRTVQLSLSPINQNHYCL